MRKVKYYKCPHCGKKYLGLQTWGNHIDTQHPGMKPEDFSYARYFYFIQTGKKSGSCIICKKPTEWNENTQKYERFCKNPKCKEKYREEFKNRMISKYGKVTLLNDMEQQKKMLANRKISGEYKFRNGAKFKYVGNYEKDFLHFLDTFLLFDPNDLMMPSPHTYEYDYINPDDKKNEGKHLYIPDAYIPSINLEIEIKSSINTDPNILKRDAIKNLEKDEMMKTIKGIKYIRIMDKDYTEFIQLLTDIGIEKTTNLSIAQESSIDIVKYDEFFNSKGVKKLKEYKIGNITVAIINAYKKDYPQLRHIRINSNTTGEIIIDKENVVGYYQTEKKDNVIWLTALEITEEYRGYQLSPQLLRRAIVKTGITNLSVNPNNTIAINLYKSFGFKPYFLSDKVIFMSRN